MHAVFISELLGRISPKKSYFPPKIMMAYRETIVSVIVVRITCFLRRLLLTKLIINNFCVYKSVFILKPEILE